MLIFIALFCQVWGTTPLRRGGSINFIRDGCRDYMLEAMKKNKIGQEKPQMLPK